MSSEFVFTKENLDMYLKELAKEIRKNNRSAIVTEIILIGGAAILANYGFREMTTDIDAVFRAAFSLKDIINRVGDKFNLPNGWLNTEFVKTGSYSPRLVEISKHYKTFANVLEVRTVSAEYLIAMKLRAGRKYKNDLSDIIGILSEHEKMGIPITLNQIDTAVQKLYDGWQDIPTDVRKFIEEVIRNGDYSEIYSAVRDSEKESKNILIRFEKDYPNVTNEENVDKILENMKAKRAESTKESVLEQLKNAQTSEKSKRCAHKEDIGL